jgi:hypothetical protein
LQDPAARHHSARALVADLDGLGIDLGGGQPGLGIGAEGIGEGGRDLKPRLGHERSLILRHCRPIEPDGKQQTHATRTDGGECS